MADISTSAVRIAVTLSVTTCDGVWFGNESGLTLTDGVATHIGAKSVGATRGRVAGVRLDNASLVGTNIARLAVRISHTLRPTPCNCVRLGNESGLASADRVSGKIDSTNGARSAWRWIAGIRFFNTALVLTDIARLAVRISYTFRFAS